MMPGPLCGFLVLIYAVVALLSAHEHGGFLDSLQRAIRTLASTQVQLHLGTSSAFVGTAAAARAAIQRTQDAMHAYAAVKAAQAGLDWLSLLTVAVALVTSAVDERTAEPAMPRLPLRRRAGPGGGGGPGPGPQQGEGPPGQLGEGPAGGRPDAEKEKERERERERDARLAPPPPTTRALASPAPNASSRPAEPDAPPTRRLSPLLIELHAKLRLAFFLLLLPTHLYLRTVHAPAVQRSDYTELFCHGPRLAADPPGADPIPAAELEARLLPSTHYCHWLFHVHRRHHDGMQAATWVSAGVALVSWAWMRSHRRKAATRA